MLSDIVAVSACIMSGYSIQSLRTSIQGQHQGKSGDPSIIIEQILGLLIQALLIVVWAAPSFLLYQSYVALVVIFIHIFYAYLRLDRIPKMLNTFVQSMQFFPIYGIQVVQLILSYFLTVEVTLGAKVSDDASQSSFDSPSTAKRWRRPDPKDAKNQDTKGNATPNFGPPKGGREESALYLFTLSLMKLCPDIIFYLLLSISIYELAVTGVSFVSVVMLCSLLLSEVVYKGWYHPEDGGKLQNSFLWLQQGSMMIHQLSCGVLARIILLLASPLKVSPALRSLIKAVFRHKTIQRVWLQVFYAITYPYKVVANSFIVKWLNKFSLYRFLVQVLQGPFMIWSSTKEGITFYRDLFADLSHRHDQRLDGSTTGEITIHKLSKVMRFSNFLQLTDKFFVSEPDARILEKQGDAHLFQENFEALVEVLLTWDIGRHDIYAVNDNREMGVSPCVLKQYLFVGFIRQQVGQSEVPVINLAKALIRRGYSVLTLIEGGVSPHWLADAGVSDFELITAIKAVKEKGILRANEACRVGISESVFKAVWPSEDYSESRLRAEMLGGIQDTSVILGQLSFLYKHLADTIHTDGQKAKKLLCRFGEIFDACGVAYLGGLQSMLAETFEDTMKDSGLSDDDILQGDVDLALGQRKRDIFLNDYYPHLSGVTDQGRGKVDLVPKGVSIKSPSEMFSLCFLKCSAFTHTGSEEDQHRYNHSVSLFCQEFRSIDFQVADSDIGSSISAGFESDLYAFFSPVKLFERERNNINQYLQKLEEADSRDKEIMLKIWYRILSSHIKNMSAIDVIEIMILLEESGVARQIDDWGSFASNALMRIIPGYEDTIRVFEDTESGIDQRLRALKWLLLVNRERLAACMIVEYLDEELLLEFETIWASMLHTLGYELTGTESQAIQKQKHMLYVLAMAKYGYLVPKTGIIEASATSSVNDARAYFKQFAIEVCGLWKVLLHVQNLLGILLSVPAALRRSQWAAPEGTYVVPLWRRVVFYAVVLLSGLSVFLLGKSIVTIHMMRLLTIIQSYKHLLVWPHILSFWMMLAALQELIRDIKGFGYSVGWYVSMAAIIGMLAYPIYCASSMLSISAALVYGQEIAVAIVFCLAVDWILVQDMCFIASKLLQLAVAVVACVIQLPMTLARFLMGIVSCGKESELLQFPAVLKDFLLALFTDVSAQVAPFISDLRSIVSTLLWLAKAKCIQLMKSSYTLLVCFKGTASTGIKGEMSPPPQTGPATQKTVGMIKFWGYKSITT